MAEEKKNGFSVRAIAGIAIFTFILALAVQALTGFHWQTTVALVVLFAVLEYILKQLEKDTATKRLLKKAGLYALVIVSYLGLRIIFGYLFNAPITNADRDLLKVGAKLISYKDLSEYGNLVLEIAFILPALGIVFGLVLGGKTVRGLIYAGSFILLLIVFWQVKQTNHANALRRNTQATINLNARHQNNSALIKEGAAASSYGIAKASITRFYRYDAETGSFFIPEDLKGFIIPRGGNVLQSKPNDKGKEFGGRYYIEVILPDENGDFLSDEYVWVNPNEFDWIDGGKVVSGEKSVVESDGNIKIVFDSDDRINALELWPKNQTILISGFGKDTVYFRDGSREVTVPASGIITSEIDQPLEMRYKKGGVLYISKSKGT